MLGQRIRTIGALGTVLLALVAGVLPQFGCEGSRQATRAEAVRLFESGRYSQSLRMAASMHARSSGSERERAALLAGMSDYELGNLDDASSWLLPIVDSRDDEIAGRASATLGLIAAHRADWSGAAIRFSNAGRRLSGEEAAQANFFAGEAYSMLGRTDAARRMYRLAQGGSRDTSRRDQLDHRLNPSSYTVQLGAFSTYTRASVAASDAQSRAVRLGLGTPRVVPSETITSSMLYLVHVGRFTTESQAQSARVQMGSDAVVVASVD